MSDPRTPDRSRWPAATPAAPASGVRRAGPATRPSASAESARPAPSPGAASTARPVVDGPLVDQHLDQLFHVERVSFGAPDDQRAQLRGTWLDLSQQFAGKHTHVARAEWTQIDALMNLLATPQSGRRSNNVGRDRQSMSIGTSRLTSQRCSRKSSEPSSAQCRSSICSTTGPGRRHAGTSAPPRGMPGCGSAGDPP